jgi:hypothetical protein
MPGAGKMSQTGEIPFHDRGRPGEKMSNVLESALLLSQKDGLGHKRMAQTAIVRIYMPALQQDNRHELGMAPVE